MSCCSRRRTEKRISRKYKIHPERRKSLDVPERRKSLDVPERSHTEMGRLIGKEYIQCGVCKESFPLNEGKIVGSCVGCDRFLHCGIAGKCVGKNCRYIIGGVEQRATWCLACVSMNEPLNQKNNNITGDCICKECKECSKR